MVVIPNFFIVGAPKCGTTSLAAYLRTHPDVFMPGHWEFGYMADDLTWVGEPVVQSDAEYLAHFEEGRDHQRIGEKSAFYLYSQRAPERIHTLNPSAKIICMFRDPVEVIISLHRYHVQELREDLLSLEEALAAEDDRKAGRRLPANANFAEDFFYRDVVRYAEQLERYFQVFDRKDVHVILFEDLKADAASVYREVLAFLNLAPHTLRAFEKHNEAGHLKNLGLRRFLHQHPRLKQAAEVLLSSGARLTVREAMSRFTGGEPEVLRAAPSPALLTRLRGELRPEADKLSRLIRRDLSHWCQRT